MQKKFSDCIETLEENPKIDIEKSIILDFNGLAEKLKNKCKCYM